jgi:tyrosyl-tRNA synthetase
MEPSGADAIRRHAAEVVTDDEFTAVLSSDDPTAYVGYAPTGELHLGHVTTIRTLVDFLEAGVDVTVLIADLHAHLDDAKTPWDLLDARSRYYRRGIEGILDAAGADPDAVEFVRGTEFELTEPYTRELFRLVATTTVARARRAGSEVVREVDDPTLGGVLYPPMQALDVAALDADIAYGGIDQRGIYMYAREVLDDPPVCVFSPLLSGLDGGKMSASAAGSINVTDDPGTVREKVADAYCPAGETAGNGVLEYCKHLVFPVLDGEPLVVERPDEYGGDVRFDDYASLEQAFVAEDLHPADLKDAVGDELAALLAPIRQRLRDDPDLLAAAYPERYA